MLTENSEAKIGRTLPLSRRLVRFARVIFNSPAKAGRALKETEASELLEFALALPLILVMVIGLLDFARGYNIKQKLANAAREGARLGASETNTDKDTANPVTVQNIYQDVTAYLKNANIDTTSLSSYTSPSACTSTSGGTTTTTPYCWEYTSSSSDGLQTLMIERYVLIPTNDVNNTILNGTRVTITYNYDWTFGFNHIINLLVPSANVAASVKLTTDAIMSNLGA